VTTGWSRTRTWDADASNIAAARHFVALQLAVHGLDDAVPDARLVVSELATNAVRHAGSRFTVTVDVTGGAVLVTVSDPSSALPFPVQASPLHDSGRGLGIVAELSASWGVTPEPHGGKSVWALIAPALPDGLGLGYGSGGRFQAPVSPTLRHE
jgi:anti-sigma regulatory factor (Ser/Thr protein kinase)